MSQPEKEEDSHSLTFDHGPYEDCTWFHFCPTDPYSTVSVACWQYGLGSNREAGGSLTRKEAIRLRDWLSSLPLEEKEGGPAPLSGEAADKLREAITLEDLLAPRDHDR